MRDHCTSGQNRFCHFAVVDLADVSKGTETEVEVPLRHCLGLSAVRKNVVLLTWTSFATLTLAEIRWMMETWHKDKK